MTSVRHTAGDYLTSTTLPTMTGAYTICGWLKNNAHSSGTEVTMFGLCSSGGDSEGFVLSTGLSAATTLTARLFNDAGSNIVDKTIYTGSYTGWLCWMLRHKASSAAYEISWRYEDDTAWQTVTLTLPAQLTTPSGDMRLGNSIFALPATDCTSRHFFVQESYLTDTQALTASRAIGSAPSGTNLHYLALASAATAATNGGTAGNWTATGTLTDHATDPTETTLPTCRYIGSGPIAYGSTSVTAVWPADVGLLAGDYIEYVIGTKPDTATIASPGAAWTLVKETSGGGGTTGADAGPTKLAVYRLTALAAGTETGNGPAVAITSGNSSWAYMRVCRNDAGGGFSVAAGGGTDSTTGAAVSVTCDVDPGLQPDDVVLCSMVVPTDVTTPDQFSAYGVTATSVSAWSSFREINEPDSTTGNDIGGFSFWGRVVTGTSSAAAVIAATASGTTTNVRGPAILSRVRGLAPAGSDFPAPRAETQPDTLWADLRAGVLRLVLDFPAPPVTPDDPGPRRQRMREERARFEAPQTRSRRSPESVDDPVFLLWGSFNGDQVPLESVQSARRFPYGAISVFQSDAAAALAGSGSLAATATIIVTASAALGGSSALGVVGVANAEAAAALAGTGALAVVGQGIATASSGLAAAAALAGTVEARATAVCSMAAQADLVTAGGAIATAAGALAGAATLDATTSGATTAAAAMDGAAGLATVGGSVATASAAFGGAADLAAVAQAVASAQAAMAAAASLSAGSGSASNAAAAMDGSAGLAAVGVALATAQAAMGATAALGAVSEALATANAALGGTGELAAASDFVQSPTASFGGSAALSAVAEVVFSASCSFGAAAVLACVENNPPPWPSLPRQSATAHTITRLQVTAPAITRQRAAIRSS